MGQVAEGGNLILISGASGFIGRRLAANLKALELPFVELHRAGSQAIGRRVSDLSDSTGLLKACEGVETVFHCAGYAHAFASRSSDDAAMHWRVNFEGTRNLVEAAGRAGVRRFVFLSSVKAMAEPGVVCADEDFPGEPLSDYGRAKQAAEAAVLEAGKRYGMHVVNLRLCMVYGAGGWGNLERMARLVKRGWFPPLPETGNHRSMVHVDDVVSAMRIAAFDDRAAGHTFIVAGPEAPSGRELFDALRRAANLPPVNWAVPRGMLEAAAWLGDQGGSLLGRRLPLDSESLDRLLGSAWYSGARMERVLGWRARVELNEGLAEIFTCP